MIMIHLHFERTSWKRQQVLRQSWNFERFLRYLQGGNKLALLESEFKKGSRYGSGHVLYCRVEIMNQNVYFQKIAGSVPGTFLYTGLY
jgi:hypothetical protein